MSVLGSLFLLLFSCSTQVELAHAVATGNWTGAEMVPLFEEGKAVMMVNESRRRLGSFQICALCTCCGSGGAKAYCVPFPVSGAMFNIIRNMPMFIADQNDPSKMVFFYQGSGMQLGVEGYTVGFLYTIVGLMEFINTEFLWNFWV